MNTEWLTRGPVWQTIQPGTVPDVLIRLNAYGTVWPTDEAHFARNLAALKPEQQDAVMQHLAAHASCLEGPGA